MAEVALREYVNEIDGMIENSAHDVAIQHGRHILSLYPKYLEVYRVLGKALLEKDDYAGAGDVFQRVIGVDPEDFVARVGLSIVHDRQGDLDRAIWHMERAYDLMPGNEIIQSELRRLYGRRDGSEPERVSLTRGALARMYANGDLTDEAITNLRQILHDQPDRVDLQVLLAEVLWRDNQRIEASDLAQTITARLPYCLKANLILGEILQASGGSDSDLPLHRAQAVDPDNSQAARLFGGESPLPARVTRVTRLEQLSYGQLLDTDGTVTPQEEVPDWLRGLSELNAPVSQLEPPESATNPPLPTGLHMPGTEPLRGEIPDWLQGLTVQQPEAAPSQELPGWLAAMGTASMTEPAEKSTSTEPADDWLANLPKTSAPEPVTAMRDEDVPDWIMQLGTGELDPRKLPQTEPVVDETPDWMKQLGTTGMLDTAASGSPAAPMAEEVPDWLRELGSTGPLDQAAPTQPATRSTAVPTESTDMPDWLRQLGSTGPLDQTAVTQPAESTDTPDWLTQLGNTGPLDQTAISTAPSGETTDWLSQLQSTVPPLDETSAEETPDWLTQLGHTGPLPEVETPPARKLSVDTDRATIERLVEAFGPSPAAPAEPVSAEVEESSFSLGDAASEVGKAGAGLVLGGAALADAAASGLAGLVQGRDEKPAEEAALSEAASAANEPTAMEAAAILEGDISPYDALAFFARLTAGKEDQLRAEAQAEGESRMAAIMGRKAEPVVEAKPVEPEPVIEPVAERVVPELAVPESAVPEALTPEPTAMEAAAILEGDISPDDALAFFARLTAGKEDQLQAEAQAEGESRMAAIMGRKAEPVVEAKPVEPEPMIEPVAEIVVPQAAVPESVVSESAVPEAPAPEPTAMEAAAILEGDISPDDALAFFARLTAGKEDQLQAEAQAEGESRMAAIMGRKTEPVVEAKPVEPEPVIEPVAEIVVPQAAVSESAVLEALIPEPTAMEAAAILEGDISPDDALAFFARLTAGKEDQLRAEAQAEGESRMAAIMGRKPTAPLVEAKQIEPEPVVEPVAQAVEPEEPIELAMPVASIESEPEAAAAADGTIDWLAQLSAAAASAGTEPAFETPAEEPQDWLKGLGEAAPVVTAADELPEWLRALRPADEALVAEPGPAEAVDEIEATPAEELPSWLRSMQPVAEDLILFDDGAADETAVEVETVSEGAMAAVTPAAELPDWLQDLQPSKAAAEPTPAEALPDWLRNLQPESIEVVADQAAVSEPMIELPLAEELPAAQIPAAQIEVAAPQLEAVAPVAEVLPELIITPVRELVKPIEADSEPERAATPTVPVPPTWWTQSAEDEGEAPIAELPEPVRAVSTTTRTARLTPAAPSAPAAATPRPAITRAMRDRLPERSSRETRRREVRPTEPRRTELPVPVVSSVNVDPLVEQLEADKFNHTVRLELARAWWSMGNRDSALAEYGKLINPAQVENLSDEELAEIEERDFADAGPVANELVVDLERIVEIDEQPAWPRLLGDLYMKTGDLARALEMYRRALSQL